METKITMTGTLQEIIKKHRVWNCLDCGKCSAVCPVTRYEARQYTSPRLLVEMAIDGRWDDVSTDPLLWSCLTCRRCSEICPSAVHFTEFLGEVRSLARQAGGSGTCTHNGLIQTLSQMMADPGLNQNRLGWLEDGLKISDDSDTVYFVGCLPYYDVIFKKLGAECLEIACAALKILNHLGIEPILMADERCCGHDALWQGDTDTFTQLARLNIENLKATQARRVVTTCPECAQTLKMDYPRLVGDHGLEVLHITELLAQRDLSGAFASPEPGSGAAQSNGRRITYQDPCRLGRHLGVYDAPRVVMDRLGFDLAEMDRARAASVCCGTTCWSSCGQVSKNIQVDRLQEASATSAELLVTACAKCQIHLKCAQEDPELGQEIGIEIRDWTTVIVETLGL
jgi:Fe-S oxidoreductase